MKCVSLEDAVKSNDRFSSGITINTVVIETKFAFSLCERTLGKTHFRGAKGENRTTQRAHASVKLGTLFNVRNDTICVLEVF